MGLRIGQQALWNSCLAHSFQRDTRTRHIVTEPLLLGYCVRLQIQRREK